jgi:hypothetical protein
MSVLELAFDVFCAGWIIVIAVQIIDFFEQLSCCAEIIDEKQKEQGK